MLRFMLLSGLGAALLTAGARSSSTIRGFLCNATPPSYPKRASPSEMLPAGCVESLAAGLTNEPGLVQVF
jgi:hypothetical protein